jgi:hypothetical protein
MQAEKAIHPFPSDAAERLEAATLRVGVEASCAT